MPQKTGPSYDVIVVGSGASGGWAAKRLAEAGVYVALVEAGRAHDTDDFCEHGRPFDLPYGNLSQRADSKTRPRQADCYACTEHNAHWFVNDHDEPYTTPAGRPFSWQGRLRMVGGRTNVWGRQSYRLSEQDMKGRSFDGAGADWPLSYGDLVPYYDIVERYVGISGQAESVPELPDSQFLPPMAMTCAETPAEGAGKKSFGRTITIGRAGDAHAAVERPRRLPLLWSVRARLHHAVVFQRGLHDRADAVATGKCTLITNAMVHQVMMDADHRRATGVRYIDRATRQTTRCGPRRRPVRAGARIGPHPAELGDDGSSPNGLANSSGALGRYLMDHLWVAGGAQGEFPELADRRRLGGPRRPNGIYVIRFRNTMRGPARTSDFCAATDSRGAAAPPSTSPRRASATTEEGAPRSGCIAEPHRLRRVSAAANELHGDRSGGRRRVRHPGLRIDMAWGENEKAMIPDMAETAAEMLDAAGARNIQPFMVRDRVPGYGDPRDGRRAHGHGSHGVGAQSVSADARRGNLYVMDAPSFPSGACQNPTLTIMALAVRSCDHLLEEMKRGTV